jgi:histidinol-phosphate/aromatic aminotransferase/cobyric acid decarboxylase-like protein
MRACSTSAAGVESERRARILLEWREVLIEGLRSLGLPFVESRSSYVLVQAGVGAHEALRRAGFAVRRADTFPGLDGSWVRIAVRAPSQTDQLVTALKSVRDTLSTGPSDALG